ncbi:MAG TPA: ATP-binding protein [Terriglobus sp.]
MGRPERKHDRQGASPNDLLQHVAVGVLAIDRNGICTRVNQAAASMFGYTKAELQGADIHTLLHHSYPDGTPYDRNQCPFLQAARTGQAVRNADQVFWSKSGQPIHIYGSALPVDNSGAVLTLQDGSSLRDMQTRLEQVQEEQTEVMRQRDAAARIERDLAQEKELRQRDLAVATERAAADQLRAQQRMAEDRLLQSEKLAAVGRLAASISHEINNPLEAVTNLLYLVRHDDSISQQANEYLEQAEQELARVTQIVSQTLRFQRAGVAPTEIVPESLIDSVLSLHQGRLHHRRIKIDRRHRQSRPFSCAEGDVRQVLNNLVGNAIDAMSKDGGTLTLRTARVHDVHTGQSGVRITVSDTGHGMPGSTAAHIFEPFYTTKGANGSGLGLWISSTLVKRLGGRISVRSRSVEGPHRGTTFSVFLPEIHQTEAGAVSAIDEARAA